MLLNGFLCKAIISKKRNTLQKNIKTANDLPFCLFLKGAIRVYFPETFALLCREASAPKAGHTMNYLEQSRLSKPGYKLQLVISLSGSGGMGKLWIGKILLRCLGKKREEQPGSLKQKKGTG